MNREELYTPIQIFQVKCYVLKKGVIVCQIEIWLKYDKMW